MGTNEQTGGAQTRADPDPIQSTKGGTEGTTQADRLRASATGTGLDDSAGLASTGPALDAPTTTRNSRKRTKTGCLSKFPDLRPLQMVPVANP
jgi:hypothetical protein